MEMEITLRTAAPSDAAALLQIYAPYVRDTAVSFEYEAPTVAEFTSRIERTLPKYPYIVAQNGAEVLGYAYAGPFHERAAYGWAVETSIYIKKDRRRLGAGRLLYGALEEALKAQGFLNLNACAAYTEREDAYLTDDSLLFHQRMGYRPVGKFNQCGYKFGRWYDMVWLEKHIGEHLAVQPPVKTFGEIRSRMPWETEP